MHPSLRLEFLLSFAATFLEPSIAPVPSPVDFLDQRIIKKEQRGGGTEGRSLHQILFRQLLISLVKRYLPILLSLIPPIKATVSFTSVYVTVFRVIKQPLHSSVYPFSHHLLSANALCSRDTGVNKVDTAPPSPRLHPSEQTDKTKK